MPMAPVQFYNRPDYIGDAFNGLIGAAQQHDQQNAQQDQFDQQRQTLQQQQQQQLQQQQIKYLLDQYQKQPADVQNKLYASAPDAIKAYLINPNLAYNSPSAQTQRQIDQQIAQNKLSTVQRFHPTGGDTSAINYDLLTNKNAPKEYLEQGYQRDYLTPQQIASTMLAPAVKDYGAAAASNASAAKTNAEVPWIGPEAKSRINLQGAQAGKAAADTAKTKVETQNTQRNTAMNTVYAGYVFTPDGTRLGSNDGIHFYNTITGELVQAPQSQVQP